jgi:glutamate-5-semialdehyde dehydrogenase
MGLHEDMLAIGTRAVAASRQLAALSARCKNLILQRAADEIESRREAIKAANAQDVADARGAGLAPPLVDRLLLTDSRIEAMARGLREVSGLRDPVGQVISRWIRPNGLEIVKQRVPIGVIVIIYESRPNVTADAAALCFKTANAVILRGGRESLRSNQAIVEAFVAGGRKKNMPPHAVQFVATPDREAVTELVRMEGRVDVVIPRGGESLIRAVVEQARVPVIKHYKGVCHTYVDASANLDMALRICENAKCQRPGVCNAMETLLVHEAVAGRFLPMVAKRLGEECRVELRGDEAARRVVPTMTAATEDDWYAEYLDLILAVRVVPSVQAAIDHITTYGSNHSDAIVAESEAAQKAFTEQVNSAAVYVNASTRFTDGGEFGMGAEIGISTDKLHARGPMGLEELTTYKYVVWGQGQIRE